MKEARWVVGGKTILKTNNRVAHTYAKLVDMLRDAGMTTETVEP
jgi:hypothetical protein